MAGMRCVLDGPWLLAACSSPSGVLAGPEQVAVLDSPAGMDGDVGRRGTHHRWLASTEAICYFLDVGAGGCARWVGILDLLEVRQEFQPPSVKRAARNHAWTLRTTPGGRRDPRPSPPPRVSGARLRNAGLESGYRLVGLLWAHRTCADHGSRYDPHGGTGIGKSVRG